MSRVLLVHQPVDGGVARHVGDLAAGLDALGWEVVVCGPARLGGTPAGVEYRRLEMGRAIEARLDARTAHALAGIVRDVRPDVVHAHSSKAGAIARLTRLVNPRLPLVYSPHLYAFAGYWERPRERRVYRALETALAPLASRVVCVCEDEARQARSIGPAGRVRLVYNGVAGNGASWADGGQAERRPHERSGEGPVVGALTLLHRRKGIQTLIDAVPAVLARHPRTRVAVFGDGPERPALIDRARARGVEDAVDFLGVCSDPAAALRSVDVFVHPSWAESFPYVILEAMAAARPIVASAVGGVPEAIVDGASGVLVAPRDDRALASAIVAVLDDDGLRVALGRRARERVIERFSLERMVGDTSAVYGELIDDRGDLPGVRGRGRPRSRESRP